MIITQKPSFLPDITGQRRGRMTIVGYYRTHSPTRRRSKAFGRGNLWWARCDCGAYEVREHRDWFRPWKHDGPDSCRGCVERGVAVWEAVADPASAVPVPPPRPPMGVLPALPARVARGAR